jgi:hypothetical protein
MYNATYNEYFSWFGLPGSGLGGMTPKTVSPLVWQVGSKQEFYSTISNVPLQTRSTKSFFGERYVSQYERLNGDYGILLRLSDEEGVPVGTIEVPSNLFESSPSSFEPEKTLKNCILVYGRWVVELGELRPGQTIQLTKTTLTSTTSAGTESKAVPRGDMRDLLIPPKTLEDTRLRGMVTYNPQSTDLEYIVRVMTLHRALGGYESTGLHHAYQSALDMSELLTTDRILFLGVATSGLEPHSAFIFRQSSPIKLTELSPRVPKERTESGGGDKLDEKMHPDLYDPSKK